MNDKILRRVRRVAGLLTAVSLTACGLCLMIGCYALYQADAFSPEGVARQFARFAPVIWTGLAITAGICLLNLFLPPVKEKRRAAKAAPAPKPVSGRWKTAALALALALLLFGFFTGGTVDVLTKAVNICTECVGLG